jgi:hypothetical protein
MGGRIASIAWAAIAISACAPAPPPALLVPQPLAADIQGHSETEAQNLWAILDPSVSPTNGAESVRIFRDRLVKLSPDDIRKIDQQFTRQLSRSYSWELWGAAYIINGGCSDDCFDYFRAWLIMQGSAVFNAAIREPDSLADYRHLSQPAEIEDALSVTRDAYHTVTGEEPDGDGLNPKLGPGWDFDDHLEMRRRYPRLCRKFNW